jgi:hypothetical protein
MKSKHRRFEATPNATVKNSRGELVKAWCTTCRQCSQCFYVEADGTPGEIWNTFARNKWRLGNDGANDECGRCIHARRQARKSQKEQRHEHEHVRGLSLNALISKSKNGSSNIALPHDQRDRRQLALAILVDLVSHNGCLEHEVLDMMAILARYCALDETKRTRELVHHLKLAAFSSASDAARSRDELHNMLDDAELKRVTVEEVKDEDDSTPTSMVKFNDRYGDLLKKPEEAAGPTKKTSPEQEQHNEVPGWLRTARERMKGKL